MINIRKNIFETNSSSMHSLCISKSNDYNIPSELHFEFGEFGWEDRFLTTCEDLGSYLYTGLYELYDEKEIEEYKNHLYELLGKHGCEATFEEPKVSKWGYLESGYIDHACEAKDFFDSLRHSDRRLLRFLFSPDSFILTGNDNNDTYRETVADTDFSKVEVYEKEN